MIFASYTRPGSGFEGRRSGGVADSRGKRMDIAELLAFSVKNKASDLHLSA